MCLWKQSSKPFNQPFTFISEFDFPWDGFLGRSPSLLAFFYSFLKLHLGTVSIRILLLEIYRIWRINKVQSELSRKLVSTLHLVHKSEDVNARLLKETRTKATILLVRNTWSSKENIPTFANQSFWQHLLSSKHKLCTWLDITFNSVVALYQEGLIICRYQGHIRLKSSPWSSPWSERTIPIEEMNTPSTVPITFRKRGAEMVSKWCMPYSTGQMQFHYRENNWTRKSFSV